MKRLIILFLVIMLALSGCASLYSTKSRPALLFLITSSPVNANISIYNKGNGQIVEQTITPAFSQLEVRPGMLAGAKRAAAAPFGMDKIAATGASMILDVANVAYSAYHIEVSKEGYEKKTIEIEATQGGWVILDGTDLKFVKKRPDRKIHFDLRPVLPRDGEF